MRICQLVAENKVLLFLFAVFWSTVFHVIYSYYWKPMRLGRTGTVVSRRPSKSSKLNVTSLGAPVHSHVDVHVEDPVFGHAGEVNPFSDYLSCITDEC